MVCGTPFLTTDTGAVGDLRGGFIVRTERTMAERLDQLANDRRLREQLGAEGREMALKAYTWRHVGDRWEELLVRMLKE